MSNEINAEVVLVRLIDYLHIAEKKLNDALLFELTDIVREGRAVNVPDLFDWSLARLNGRAGDPLTAITPPQPPLQRGAIGYNTHQRIPEKKRHRRMPS